MMRSRRAADEVTPVENLFANLFFNSEYIDLLTGRMKFNRRVGRKGNFTGTGIPRPEVLQHPYLRVFQEARSRSRRHLDVLDDVLKVPGRHP